MYTMEIRNEKRVLNKKDLYCVDIKEMKLHNVNCKNVLRAIQVGWHYNLKLMWGIDCTEC